MYDLRIVNSENGIVSVALSTTQISPPSVVQIQVSAGPIFLQILTVVIITLELLVNIMEQTARKFSYLSFQSCIAGRGLLQQL